MINKIQEISIETWDKLQLLNSNIDKLSEEGFTQDLLYKILKNSPSMIVIDTTVKDHESKTGADFFWNIGSTNQQTIKLGIQAKRAYSKYSRYNSLEHFVGGKKNNFNIPLKRQDKLLNLYCHQTGYEPYYVFYNTFFVTHPSQTVNRISAYGSDRYFDFNLIGPEIFGITITPAYVVTDFIENSVAGNFLNFLYRAQTLSLSEFLSRTRDGNSTDPSPGPVGPSNPPDPPNNPNDDKTPGSQGSHSKKDTSNSSDLKSFDGSRQSNDNSIFHQGLKVLTSDELIFLFSSDEFENPDVMINEAKENFKKLKSSVTQANNKFAKELFEKELLPKINVEVPYLGSFKKFSKLIEIVSKEEHMNRKLVSELHKEIKHFRKKIRKYGRNEFDSSSLNEVLDYIEVYKEVERVILKIKIILKTKPGNLIYTNID